MPNDLLTTAETESREVAPFEAAPVPPTPASMLQVIARAASDPRVDVDKMQALLQMQRELMADQARAEFNDAMARLQPRLPRIPKRGLVDRGTGKGKFPYGKWEDIDELIRPLLNEEGFSLSFDTKARDDGMIIVTGSLRHRSGHIETSSIGPLPPDPSGGKNPAQAIGSATQYGRRYSAINLLNLTFEGLDDDGQGGATDDFIDANSVSQIGVLLKETDSNVAKFLENFGVVEVGELRQSQYGRAINLLLAKKRRLEDERAR